MPTPVDAKQVGNGDAKLAIERLRVRREMRSAGEEELSAVIEQEAAARSEGPKSDSPAPGPFGWLVNPVIVVVRSVPERHRVWPVMLLLLLVAAVFAASQGWLRFV